MADYFGILGLTLLAIGWLIELWAVIKTKKAQVPLNFAVLYCAGSLLLTLHSLELGDAVFTVLNGFATLIALVNIAVCVFFSGKSGKNSKSA